MVFALSFAAAAEWVRAHPEVWPLVLMLLSLGLGALKRTPRGKAFVEMLESIGIDAPKLVDAVRRLVTGQSLPPPGRGDGDRDAILPPPPSEKPPTSPRISLAWAFPVVALMVLGAFGPGCSAAQNRRTANTVLDVAQITCVLLSRLTDEKAVQAACGIEDALVPELRKLLAGKAAAQRAGADGGMAQ